MHNGCKKQTNNITIMRKTYLGALLLAGTLAFTACQNETIIYLDENGNPIENVELKEGEGILKINLSNTSANSRAARPVGSSAAANNVNTVKVYVYSSTTNSSDYALDTNAQLKSGQESSISISNGIITITNYKGEVEHENNYSETPHDVATIKLTNLTPKKYYKFVAVGYNDASNGGGDNPYGEPTFTSFSTTTSTEKTGYGVEELFAGVSTEMQTTDKANFATSPSITMERQVAGMLGYFTKVPTKINDKVVKYVKVYANKGFKKFKYPSLEDFNGDASSVVSENNGKTELLTFDMETIATNWNAGNPGDGNYTFADCSSSGLQAGASASQTAPLATGYKAPAGLKLVENSIFGGCYIIPYDKQYESGDSNGMLSTLTVELQDGSNFTLKTLKVYTNQESSVGKYFYDIRRNNFYSIGQKFKTDTTTPTDPKDPDEPIDLSGNTDIVVTINDAWKVLHNMGVEE